MDEKVEHQVGGPSREDEGSFDPVPFLGLTDEEPRRPMTPEERSALLARERTRLTDPAYRRELREMEKLAAPLLDDI